MTDASMVTNLWPYSLQVGLLVIAMGATLALLRVPSPRFRLVAWRVVLAVALLLPLQPWRVTRVIDAGAIAGARTDVAGASAVDAANAARGKTTEEELDRTAASTTSGIDAIGMWRTIASIDWTVAIVTTLVAGAICRLLWLAFGWHRLHRRLRRQTAESHAPESIAAWQARLQERMGTAARIAWIDDLSQPITFGVWPAVVLLPTRLAALPEEMQQAVICHELLHVKRRDWLWVLGEEIARAAFWFHPAVWWLLDQVQAAREELVDRLTMRVTARRRPYLEALLAFAAEPDEPISGAAAAFFRSRQLGRRIASLMREGTMTHTQRIATTTGLALTLAAALTAGVLAFPLHALETTTAAIAPPSMVTVVASPASTQATGATQPTTSTPSKPAPRAVVATEIRGPAPKVMRLVQKSSEVGPLERRARTLPKDAAAPKRVVDVPFEFPSELATYANTALVQVRLVLDESGAVVESRMLSSSVDLKSSTAPKDELNRAIENLGTHTLNVVRQWRYEPIENAPLALTVTVYYNARSGRWNASDDASPRPRELSPRPRGVSRVPEDDSTAGLTSGISSGISGGVADGVAEGIRDGVAGGVRDSVASGVRDGVAHGIRNGVADRIRDGVASGIRDSVADAIREGVAGSVSNAVRLSGSEAPRVIEETRPRYPVDAMKARIQGSVIVDLDVGTDGRVIDAHVVKSVPGLDEAAVEAAKQWRFARTYINGVAVPVVLTMTMSFTMR